MFHDNLDDERAELTYKLIIKLVIIILTIVVVASHIYFIITT